MTLKRESIWPILAISALLHGTDEAVRKTAKRLIPHVGNSTARKYLHPLSDPRTPSLSIVLDSVIDPPEEQVMGSLYLNGYEYDIIAHFKESIQISTVEFAEMVADHLLARGIISGTAIVELTADGCRRSFRFNYDMANRSRWSLSDAA